MTCRRPGVANLGWRAKSTTVGLGCLLCLLVIAVGVNLIDGPAKAFAQPRVCAGSDAQFISGHEVEQKLRNDERVFLNNFIIKGDVNVRRDVSTVSNPVVLINSTVEGNWSTPFVAFKAPVNFRNTCFHGDVDIYSSHFDADSDLSEAHFDGKITAGDAHFAQLLDLGDIIAAGHVSFDRAEFRGGVYAARAEFGDEVHFVRAAFSASGDFSRAHFNGAAFFELTSASADLDFSLSHFCTEDKCASSPSSPPAFDFDGLNVAGTLNFTAAQFGRQAILTNIGAARLKMRDSRFAAELDFAGTAPSALEMDIDAVLAKLQGGDPQVVALRHIEDTARTDGDIALANEASFKRQTIDNEGNGGLRYAAGWFFGEQIAGYLVLPLRPFRAMALVVAFAVLLRTFIRARRKGLRLHRPTWKAVFGWLHIGRPQSRTDALSETPRKGSGGGVRSRLASTWNKGFRWITKTLVPWTVLFGGAVGASLVIAFNPKPPNVAVSPERHEDLGVVALAGARWAEWGVQKALNTVLVIAIGNAIPGAKEVIDAILKR